MDKLIRHRVNAGRVAVKNQVSFFGSQFGQVPSEWKADGTRVTFADFAISEKVFTELRSSFPKDHFCSEESSPSDELIQFDPRESRFAWVLDPIDGTNNYAIGLSCCAISLALLMDGLPIYGYIYDFQRNRLIEGGPQTGIVIGSRKIQAANKELDRRHSIVAGHFPLSEDWATRLQPAFQRYRIRSLGSGSLHLTFTAMGMFDGCFDSKVKVWDIAAAYALLEAAGRRIRFLETDPFPMTSFHVNTPYCPYIAGTPAFMEFIEPLLARP